MGSPRFCTQAIVSSRNWESDLLQSPFKDEPTLELSTAKVVELFSTPGQQHTPWPFPSSPNEKTFPNLQKAAVSLQVPLRHGASALNWTSVRSLTELSLVNCSDYLTQVAIPPSLRKLRLERCAGNLVSKVVCSLWSDISDAEASRMPTLGFDQPFLDALVIVGCSLGFVPEIYRRYWGHKIGVLTVHRCSVGHTGVTGRSHKNLVRPLKFPETILAPLLPPHSRCKMPVLVDCSRNFLMELPASLRRKAYLEFDRLSAQYGVRDPPIFDEECQRASVRISAVPPAAGLMASAASLSNLKTLDIFLRADSSYPQDTVAASLAWLAQAGELFPRLISLSVHSARSGLAIHVDGDPLFVGPIVKHPFLEELALKIPGKAEISGTDLPRLRKFSFGELPVRRCSIVNFPSLEWLSVVSSKELAVTACPRLRFLQVQSQSATKIRVDAPLEVLCLDQVPKSVRFASSPENLEILSFCSTYEDYYFRVARFFKRLGLSGAMANLRSVHLSVESTKANASLDEEKDERIAQLVANKILRAAATLKGREADLLPLLEPITINSRRIHFQTASVCRET